MKIHPVRCSWIAKSFWLGVFMLLSTQVSLSCGADSDCKIGDRHYRIRMPEGHDGKSKVGAIFYMHGWRSSAKAVMKNKSLGKAVSKLGLALIAPKSAHAAWAIPGSPSQAKPVELEFFDELVEDVSTKFSIDTNNMMASGFSAGGMMVWHLACHRSDMFKGFAPIAGTYWEPVPETCTAPVASIIHTHGTSDDMVPLEGREIGNTRQGDVFLALDRYARFGEFRDERNFEDEKLKLKCRELHNEGKQLLEVCLHPGGHSMKTSFVTRAWKKFVQSGLID